MYNVHLPKFLASALSDSGIAKNIQCSRTKATELTTDCIFKEACETLRNKLHDKVYSLIMDETTDIPTQKSLTVLIRFWDDETNSIKDKFLTLIRMNSCNAESIFEAVCEALKENGIPVENLIGLAADNAAVMMGQRNSVQAKFKEINPNIFVLGCTCHSIHLCASAAASKLPKAVEELARNIFNHFSTSSNRAEGLGEFQVFTNIKPVKMLHPSQTRWLSLQAVVDRILHSWDALKLYFIHAVQVENLQNSKIILDSLHTPLFKIYFFFLSYILDLVNKLNLEFQSESLKIHVLLPRVTELYSTILRNYIGRKYLNDIAHLDPANPRIFLPLDQIYFGARVEQALDAAKEGIPQIELTKFKTSALDFYVELASQIKKRFKFDDPLLQYITKFDPKKAISGEVPSIVGILKFFPQLNIEIS